MNVDWHACAPGAWLAGGVLIGLTAAVLGTGGPKAFVFVGAMLPGMAISQLLERHPARVPRQG